MVTSIRPIVEFYVMCLSVYVGVEGFTLPGRFIVKELTLMFSNGEFNHTLFEAPKDYCATTEDLVTIKYTTNFIHGLSFKEGDMPYIKLTDFIGRLDNCKVFCYGDNTRRLIQSFIPFTPVVDIRLDGYVMPTVLPSSNCGRNHAGRNCSMSKTFAVKQYCESREVTLH